MWQRHGLLTKHERLLRLEKATAERKIELTDEQIRLLERFSPEFRERHIEAPHTGSLVAVDTFFVGVLKGVGKVYLQTAIDCHSPLRLGQALPVQAAGHRRPSHEQRRDPDLRGRTTPGSTPCSPTMAASSAAGPTSTPTNCSCSWRTSSTAPPGSSDRSPTASSSASTARYWISDDGGDDIIITGDGNDTIELFRYNSDTATVDVGNGNNTVRLSDGNSIVSAGNGNDALYQWGELGSHSIDLGDGDNVASLTGGAITIVSGSGSDTINLGYYGTRDISTGAGNDTVNAASYYGSATLDLGAGNDLISLQISNTKTVTLGTGQDSVTLTSWDNTAKLVVTDFATGPAGDTIDITPILANNLIGWDGDANPFGSTGFLRLVQDGANALLQVDRNGAAGADQVWTTLVEFQNTNAASFARGNILPPYPLGGGSLGSYIIGGAGPDTLNGGINADWLIGNDGDDILNGGNGDDIINGGGGADTLTGGLGRDVLIGGDGIDVATYAPLVGGGGLSIDMQAPAFSTGEAAGDSFVDVEIIRGTSGGDTIRGDFRANTLEGLGGDDTLDGAAGDDVLDGGTETDTAVFSGSRSDYAFAGTADELGVNDSVADRDGADTVRNVEFVRFADGTYTTAELLLPPNLSPTDISIASPVASLAENTATAARIKVGDISVTDDGHGTNTLGLSGADAAAFEIDGNALYLRAGTTLDYESGKTSFSVTLSAVDDTVAGATPVSTTYTLEVTDVVDRVVGTIGDDALFGGSGPDRLDGKAGADSMAGGDGSDIYFVDNPGDQVIETNADQATGGVDRVYSTISFELGANTEYLYLRGEDAIDGNGNELANTIYGNAAGNHVHGGAGDDRLVGGAGADTLTGGDGGDTYYFDDAGDIAIETNADFETGGNDRVISSVSVTLGANIERLHLTGSDAIDGIGNQLSNHLVGNAGTNVLYGGGGDDRLDGRGGADLLIGGQGGDSYYVDNVDDQVMETNADLVVGGLDRVVASVDYSLGANVENLLLIGSSAINGTGNSLANSIVGNAEANVITGGDGDDRLDGRGGADLLIGGQGGDFVLCRQCR